MVLKLADDMTDNMTFELKTLLLSNKYLLLATFARSVRQVMDRVVFLPFMAQARSARRHENNDGKNLDP